MRLLNFLDVDGPAVALFLEGRWVNLSAADDSMPTNVQDMLVAEVDSLEKLANLAASAPQIDTQPARILPPIAAPQKIICVGLNYREHARETGQSIPDEPLIFSKLNSTLIGHEAKIVLPSVSDQVDFEAELVVVIGKRGRNILAGQALEHIAGYCCGNDVSARDWQKGKPGRQWLLGKSFDTFAPLGPWMIPAEAVPDPGNLNIQCRVNGKTMQHSNTRDLIFPVEQLICYISSVCTLEVGDLLFTGTPSGVGVARQPPRFLEPGDRVEVEIEQIGTLANSVVASE
ncbi:MAG: fumarylacetoacetate hydrolase family protein [Planctomycetota bacterium]|nr:fumarylacetoacetate hydrolase family protein [Planctomycetota bacterium]